jgi:DUF177 domain-containing protein
VRIDLANIAGTPGARGRYSVSEDVAPTDDVSCVGPVTGELEVENTGSLLLVRGRLHAFVRLTCVRCLQTFERPLDIVFEEEFATGETEPDVATMDRDEPETSAMDSLVLDVAELTRQQLAIHMPMAPVCREECRGMCPHCGQDLAQGACRCSAEPADSRWSRLSELLRSDAEKDDR